jgi:hypothetical protein
MRALSLTDDQLGQLRATAATLRNDLLKLIAGYMNVEGETTDAAFARAYSFALDALHSHRDVN